MLKIFHVSDVVKEYFILLWLSKNKNIYILNSGAFLIKGSDEQRNISRKIPWLMSNARTHKMAMVSLVFAAYSAVL